MTELRLRNPQWTAKDLESWALCWAELWHAGVRWEWSDDDAWNPEIDHRVKVEAHEPDSLDGYIPLPETAVLLQLWAGVRTCTIEVSDTCHYELESLVDRRCRVQVRVA